MKVLYISNYQEASGYSTAARDYILALDSVGVDVVPRRLHITGSEHPVPEKILELEKKSDKKPNVIIQHSLPHAFHWTPKAKCVGMFAWETSDFNGSSWSRYLNQMDEVWVFNRQMVQACQRSHVTKPIRVIPHAVDTFKFQKSYPKLELPSKDFLFYFIGESIKRKNLPAFVQAFHTEFDPREPVSIVIKTNVPGMSPSDGYNFIAGKCNEIKHGIKKFWSIDKYKPEMIITDNMSEDKMNALHRSCNCLVAPSYGEAWCLPALDAMGHGNPVIVSDNTGFKDYVDNGCGILVKCREVPVFGMVQSLQDLYTSDETWWEPDILDLQVAMRGMYEDSAVRKQMGLKGLNKAFQFSHQAVGRKMKKALEELCSTSQ